MWHVTSGHLDDLSDTIETERPSKSVSFDV
jgi:hypothetical protein